MKKVFDDRSIDENNFLEYDIKNLRNLSNNQDYHNAIDRLVKIREVLSIAQKAGRIQSIGNRAYYIEALRWLKCEAPISVWYPVPQITDLSTLTDDNASGFNTFTEHLLQNLQTEQAYSQIELAILTAPEVRSLPLSKRLMQMLDQGEKKLDDTALSKVEEIKNVATGASENVNDIVNNARAAFNQELEQNKHSAYAEIDNRLQEASAQLKAAVALDDWGRHYDDDIDRLNKRLYGQNFNGTFSRNFQSFSNAVLGVRAMGWRNLRWFHLIKKVIYLFIKNLISAAGIIWSKLASLAARRTYAFIILSIVALAMVLMPILSITGVIHSSLFDTTDPLKWLGKVALWLPAVIVFSIGYSFTTKNYRIYANMLDQYYHRKAVARTAQGIILGVEPSDANKEFRAAMTTAAAVALFEHKITGHLSKKEVESLGLLDVVKSVR